MIKKVEVLSLELETWKLGNQEKHTHNSYTYIYICIYIYLKRSVVGVGVGWCCHTAWFGFGWYECRSDSYRKHNITYTTVTYICEYEFLRVINTRHSDLALGYVKVVVNVIREEAHFYI